MVRHALGVLGVLAAGVLLAVSAAMNYRFGFSLGKTEMDGQIYGLASAAADCFKALAPFFFFAAIRNKMWSQAMAAAVVWIVVTGYSMTSAVGHAALNRLDTTGQRAVEAASYKDLRSDLKRAQEQLAWIPQHRPAATVEADIAAQKTQRMWTWTNSCNAAATTTNAARTFCSGVHKLEAERASALEAQKLEARISELNGKLGHQSGTAMAEADPQASVLSKLLGINIETIQTGLALFVALLIEIGSGFGMYVAFAYWNLDGRQSAPRDQARHGIREETKRDEIFTPVYAANDDDSAPREVAVAQRPVAPQVAARVLAPSASSQGSAALKSEPDFLDDESEPAVATPADTSLAARRPLNDNRVAVAHGVPDSDVQRFYRERVMGQEGSSVTAQDLYEDYCVWCEEQDKEPFAAPRVSREIKELGVRKERIGGRIRYIGIALRSTHEKRGDPRRPASITRAA